MIRNLVFIFCLVATIPAAAIDFRHRTGIGPDEQLACAPLGERTVSVTARAIRLVDWTGPVGWRDSTLAEGDFDLGQAYARDGHVYVRSGPAQWYDVREVSGGRVLAEPLNDGLWPPSTTIGGQDYHLDAGIGQLHIYRALTAGGPVASFWFDSQVSLNRVVVAGDRAVAYRWREWDEELWIQVADLSDPAAPLLGPVVTLASQEVFGAVVYEHALLVTGRVLNSYDISDVTQPTALDEVGPISWFRSPFVRDDGMLVVWHGRDLRLYDCSDPGNIHGGLSMPNLLLLPYGDAPTITCDERRIVSAVDHGAQQFLLPQGYGGITDGGVAWWQVEGDLVASNDRWAWVQGEQRYAVDLSGGGVGRATIEAVLDSDGLGGGTRFLAHHAGHLFYVAGRNTLSIEDVSDPLAPVTVHTSSPVGGIDAVALADDLLAVGHGETLDLYDVAEPATPVWLGEFVVEGEVAEIGLHGQRSYVASRGDGRDDRLVVVDLTDPTAPSIQSTVDFDDGDPGTLWQVAQHVMHDDALLLRLRQGTEHNYDGFRTDVVHLADPAAPQVTQEGYGAAFFDDYGSADAVAFAGFHVTTSSRSLRLFQYTGDPFADGQYLDSHEVGFHVRDMTARGTLLYVLAPPRLAVYTLTGAQPVTVPDPAPAAALTVAPNPFNPRATIAFAMPHAGRAAVAIHDLRGRRVRTLVADLAAGPANLIWDGTAEDGRALPSGVYLVRVTTPGSTLSTRCALVR